MSKKHYISAEQLLDDSFKLGIKILESGFKPNFIAGVWRGGTPVAIAVHELLDYCGIETEHVPIKTSSYIGINQQAHRVKVSGLDYLVAKLNSEDRLLILDDVFDSGNSIKQIAEELQKFCGSNLPEIRIATPYFKPAMNKTDRVPDYHLHETEDWLVFPHELSGLTASEIIQHKPGADALASILNDV